MDDMINVSVNRKPQPFHWQQRMELNLILRGSARGILNNEESRLEAGDLWLINRDVVHGIEDCSDDMILVQLHMNMEKFNQYIPDIWTVYFKCGPGNDDVASMELKDEIRGHMCNIVGIMAARQRDTNDDNKIIYACIEILNTLKMGFNLIGKAASDVEKDENFNRVWRVTDYIYDNCNRKLTLKEVADREYVSEAYLSRILKKETGRNFEETVAYVRAECSIRYLLESDMTITDISYECGFSAPRYYNAAFKKFCGCTPAEYRKKIKSSIRYSDDVSADSLVIQEGVDRDELRTLLSRYSRDTYLQWESVRISIDIDDMGASGTGLRKNDFKTQMLKLTTKEALSAGVCEKLARIRDDLRIDRVILMGDEADPYRELAENNIRYLGMEIIEPVESVAVSAESPTLQELYDRRGLPSVQYYVCKLFNETADEYIPLNGNTFAYRKDGIPAGIEVVLFNLGGKKTRKYAIAFEGESARQPFVILTKTAGRCEEDLIIRKAGDEGKRVKTELAQRLRQPVENMYVVDDLRGYTLEEQVESGQVKVVTVIPLYE